MTTFRGSPRLMKVAIIGIDPLNPLASAIVCQYNPDTLTRMINVQSGNNRNTYKPTARTIDNTHVYQGRSENETALYNGNFYHDSDSSN
jgi:hypothetical protein